LRLVASGLVYDAAAQQLHAQVAIRNAGSQAVRGPRRVLLSEFDPQEVQPVNAEPLPCPACIPCPCWPWAYDYTGKYGDDGGLDPGETSQAVEWILQDPTGQSFSFRARLEPDDTPAPGTIAGKVFVDANGDGLRQEFEPGIPGVAIHLAHDDTGQDTTTDTEGGFQFQVTEEGLYEVNATAAPECPLLPAHRSVIIVRRDDGTLSGYGRADFACRHGQVVGPVGFFGVVFNDLDHDGRRSPGEPGVPNVLITADAANCPTFAPIQTRTDERGAYQLAMPGCPPPYRVGHETVPGYFDTTPNPLVFDTVVPPDSGYVPPHPDPTRPPDPVVRLIRADFGVAPATPIPFLQIQGFVFDDLDADGRPGPLEPGMPGVAVNISGLQCANPGIVKHTDEQGRFTVQVGEVPCPPPWRIHREALQGRCDTTQNPIVVPSDPLPLPPIIEVSFGSSACDSVPGPALQGTVFADFNRNGIRDQGEIGVPDVTLRILSPCEALWEARTDARGHYRFRNLACEILGVQIERPDFPAYTTPNPFLLPGNVLPDHVDFGVARAR
jgi:hypothetical protein